LAHPNVVEVLDMGVDPERGAYLVMEFLEGMSLADVLSTRGPVAPREIIAWLLPIADALAEAHARGIVHRDLKPDNIFLARTRNGVVPKLLDFGIAKLIEPQLAASVATRVGTVLGTPHYMAPEQLNGAQEASSASDVWSLGVILYQALTGVLPFDGATLPAIFYNITQCRFADPRSLRGSLADDAGAALITACLTPNPVYRVRTASAFADALRAHPAAPRMSFPAPAPDGAVTAMPQVSTPPAPRRAASPVQAVLAIAAGIILTSVAWGVFSAHSSAETPPDNGATVIGTHASGAPAPSPPVVGWLMVANGFEAGTVHHFDVIARTAEGVAYTRTTHRADHYPYIVQLNDVDPRAGRVEVVAFDSADRILGLFTPTNVRQGVNFPYFDIRMEPQTKSAATD
ncbi:MAG: protein kinase, partial [Myxococcales bacterium]|nr:protein kinase [Myxococcales bacterium]